MGVGVGVGALAGHLDVGADLRLCSGARFLRVLRPGMITVVRCMVVRGVLRWTRTMSGCRCLVMTLF